MSALQLPSWWSPNRLHSTQERSPKSGHNRPGFFKTNGLGIAASPSPFCTRHPTTKPQSGVTLATIIFEAYLELIHNQAARLTIPSGYTRHPALPLDRRRLACWFYSTVTEVHRPGGEHRSRCWWAVGPEHVFNFSRLAFQLYNDDNKSCPSVGWSEIMQGDSLASAQHGQSLTDTVIYLPCWCEGPKCFTLFYPSFLYPASVPQVPRCTAILSHKIKHAPFPPHF